MGPVPYTYMCPVKEMLDKTGGLDQVSMGICSFALRSSLKICQTLFFSGYCNTNGHKNF